MFQNISEEIKQEEIEDVNENESKVGLILKNILKLQNVIVYIITFCISTVRMGLDITPFGIVMFAVACGSTVPAGIVLIVAGIGTLVAFGVKCFIEYIITAALFMLLTIVIRPKKTDAYRNEENKVGFQLFAATLIVQVFKYLFGNLLLYDLFVSIIASVLVFVFYKIFVNGIVVINNFKIKLAFSIEEVIGASVILALAAFMFNGISICGFSISNVLAILLTLILGWKYGMLAGATSGIATGITLGLIGVLSPVQIAVYALSGLLAGILNKFGKIGVVIGFVLGNVIITFIANGNTNILVNIREILVAALGLLLVPKTVELNIQDLMGKYKLLDVVGETRLKSSPEAEKDLNNVSDTLDVIINNYNDAATKLAKEEKEALENRKNKFIEEFLEEFDESQENIFYEDLVENDDLVIGEIFDACMKNDMIVEKDIIDIFESHNNFIVEQDSKIKEDLSNIAKLSNKIHKKYQMNDFWKKQESKNKKEISNQLKGVSKAISNIKEKMSENGEFDEFSKKIQELLNERNIACTNVNIRQAKNKKYIVSLSMDINDSSIKEQDKIKCIENIITKILKNNVTLQKENKNLESQEYEQIYSSADKFSLQVGTAKTTKQDSEVSGDSNMQVKLEDGKYMLLISDGMGSGKEAKQNSKLVIKMMKNLLATGFDKQETVELINSTLKSSSKEESFATIDMTILDLYEGNIEFIKNGACNTYIKNKSNVSKVEIKNLPVGILENTELSTYERIAHDGDIIIMCSDGIIDSKEEIGNNDWLEGFIKNINTNNVQKIADLILSEAVDSSYGVAKDDMTVIVAKIVTKKG